MSATLLIPPKARFFTAAGLPLSGGKVYSYVAGTTTPKSTYTDSTGLVPNTNPLILDANGETNIWLDGNYKIRLTDANDVDQWTVDNVNAAEAIADYYATTGIPNAYVLTPSPPIDGYAAGMTYKIRPNFNNTGPATINISGQGPKSLTKNGADPLVANDLTTDRVYEITYDGAQFQVMNISSEFTTITLGTIIDANGNELVVFNGVSSAVNHLRISNAITGTAPIIEAAGDNTNIPIILAPKAAAAVQIAGNATNAGGIRFYENTASGTNYTGIKGAETIAADTTFVLPSADGTRQQMLLTNGSATLSFGGNPCIQTVRNTTGASTTGTIVIPLDDTVPQNTEGNEYMTLSITPTNALNIIQVKCILNFATSAAAAIILALFQDSDVNAKAATYNYMDSGNGFGPVGLIYAQLAGTTSPITFRLRAGPQIASTLTFNGLTGTRRFGGVMCSTMEITEYPA